MSEEEWDYPPKEDFDEDDDTDGCYCPFNKTYPFQAKVVHEIREILREKIEK